MVYRKAFPLLAFGLTLLAVPIFSQTFDASGTGLLKGNYFVREVLITGQNTDGTIMSAQSAIGTVAFDGNGGYSFTGQGASSSSGANANLRFDGTYKVAANGFLRMTCLVDNSDVDYGGISALGPSAFVASATEGSSVSVLVGIPAGSNVNNGAFRGNYSTGYLDFLNADINMLRQANFRLAPDGAGTLGSVSVTGKAVNIGNGAASTQAVSGVTYSLTGQGSGIVTFGGPSTSQLISGAKDLYISSDQNIVIGGSATGYDLFVGIKSFTGTASNSSANGVYYIAGLENSTNGGNAIDGFYGSVNATGTGVALYHNRFQSFADNVFDYTFDSSYSVSSDGTFAPADLPYQFTLGNGGQAFVATGTGTQYSLMVGLGTVKYQGTGVYLNPLGVVNAANFAPVTNSIAPNEYVALYGTGLAAGTARAKTLPLPTTLENVSVTVNGIAAPLFYVSPTQIAILVPSSISPSNASNPVYYATLQVTSNGVASNPVTVYTADTAPGVFTQGGNGVGLAAAQRSDYTLLTSSNPAKANDTVIVYLGGLGSVTPAVADGTAASGTSLSRVNAQTIVDFGGKAGTVAFAGLTPGLAGLYQINTAVPPGIGATGEYYVNISTPDAYASQSTINISSGSASGAALSTKPLLSNLQTARKRTVLATRPQKGAGMLMRNSGMGR